MQKWALDIDAKYYDSDDILLLFKNDKLLVQQK